MDIHYSKRSQFLEACEAAIRDQREELERGGFIRVFLGEGGYEEEVTVFVTQGDRDSFHTNWSSPDPSRFPVRIKAAATALLNCGCKGTFQITHHKGEITISAGGGQPAQSKPAAVPLARPIISHSDKTGIAPEAAPIAFGPSPQSAPGKIFLVSCVSQKQPYATAARDLYTSDWFVKARRYVEAQHALWFILSAEHGLLHPDQVVAPYERTLNTMGVIERRHWAERVIRQLDDVLSGVGTAEFLAGERYRENLIPELGRRGISVSIPMQGLRIGEQLGWLGARI